MLHAGIQTTKESKEQYQISDMKFKNDLAIAFKTPCATKVTNDNNSTSRHLFVLKPFLKTTGCRYTNTNLANNITFLLRERDSFLETVETRVIYQIQMI